jgi:hypothetical protein
MANILISINAPESAGTLNGKFVGLSSKDPKTALAALENYIHGICGGVLAAGITVNDGVCASATATLNAVVATNTVTVNGVVFTAVAAGTAPSATQFVAGNSDEETAASIAAQVNASTNASILGVLRACANGKVVTFTAVAPGTGGNSLTLAGTATRFTVSGATFAGGAAGSNVRNFSLGA